MSRDLFPLPALSIGVTGHRNLNDQAKQAQVAAIRTSLVVLFGALRQALPAAVARDASYFSGATPLIRVVMMGAEGADLLAAEAAVDNGLEIALILPFDRDEYIHDFSAASAPLLTKFLAAATTVFELPGRRSEGPQAYERANGVIISNVDLLVAVWDGERARGRAGTGDFVQEAVVKGVPVLVIDPRSPDRPTMLAAVARDVFDPPAATDLERLALPSDLTGFIHSIIGPPAAKVRRQGLDDLIAEAPHSAAWRIEYPLLLDLVVGHPRVRTLKRDTARQTVPLLKDITGSPAISELPSGKDGDPTRGEAAKIEQVREFIDLLAVRYGRLFRSSSVSQYLLVILGVWVSGVVGLVVPWLSAASMAIQLTANGLVLADAALRATRRWQQRWLDYRMVAERLRWLSFRAAFGLGAIGPAPRAPMQSLPWTDWYVRRMARAMGPPRGRIDDAAVAAATDYLLNSEIPEQIDYHRVTFRQLGRLERRLLFGAHAALLASVAIALLLGITALYESTLAAMGLRPMAIVMLTVLPATMTALNGLRVDADLVRLVERSAQTVALLFRLRRVIVAAPDDYDHVASNMQRLASIMGNELAEWRFVIESRRSRGRWRKIKRKRGGLWRSRFGAPRAGE